MAATLDVGTATAILKEYYSNQRVTDLTYKDAPLYAMIKKRKDFYGETFPLPMRVNNPQGRSSQFANAQAQQQQSTYSSFFLMRKKNYAVASITSEAIMASESNAGAFLELATGEIDGAMESLSRSISWSLYGDGSGAIGTVGTITAANPVVITLSQADDVVKFEVGQTLQGRSGASVQAFGTGATSGLITAVDRDAGKITIGVDGTSGQTVVANSTLNVVGDYNAMLSGLAAWIPSTAPTTGDSFFGVDRSIDATRLAGVRVNSVGKPIDEAVIDAARRLGREGKTPDTLILSFDKWAAFEKTLGAKVQYVNVKPKDSATVGFSAIEIAGPKGTIRVMADKDCPSNRGYMLKMDTWTFMSLKEPVQMLNLDGNQMLRQATSDAYEVRVGTYSQLGCEDPSSNAVLLF